MSLVNEMIMGTNFSMVEKSIAQYIFENSDEVLNMTIGELAKATYSSNAGIIRLCKKLGLSGFREFKIKYAQELEKYRHNKKYVDVNYPFHSLENPSEVLLDIATLTKSSIDACYNELNGAYLYKISQIIFNSRNVYTFAIGDSLIRAKGFGNKLLKINKHIIDTSNKEPIVFATYATSQDCALFITYSANYNFIEYAQIMKSRGVKIITITSNPNSILSKLSDYVISFPSLEDPINSIATFYSQISLDYILNCLYSLIYSTQYAENQKNKSKVDAIRLKNHRKI